MTSLPHTGPSNPTGTSAGKPNSTVLHQARVALLGSASCALFSVLLLSLAYVDGVPVTVLAAVIALAVLSAWKPHAALTFLAAAVPMAAWTGRWWNGRVAWPEVLVVAFAAGYGARAAWLRRARHDRLFLPIVVFTALVVASLAVRVLVLYWTIGGAALRDQLAELVRGDYFIGAGGFPELDAAMRLIEGMVLLRAASTAAHESPRFAPRLIRWFVAGAAAAAALNLWRVWQGALRLDDPVLAFIRYLVTLRYNVHYADVNAAGSYFVMALLAALGVALATGRATWIGVALLIASSLLLSGSRAALLAGGLLGIAWFVHGFWRSPARPNFRTAIAAAVLLAIAAAGTTLLLGLSKRSAGAATAMQIRLELAETTFRMLKARPLFGIGIGQYRQESVVYSDPILIDTFRVRNENAHNNFFQVLGEMGLAGAAAFLWVLGAAAWSCARLTFSVSEPLQRGAVAGLLAFVLTWMSGHPLLIDEPALLFWLLLGTTVGASGNQPPTAVVGRHRAEFVGVLILIGIVFSVPLRASHEVADADLEHRGIGLSAWQQGEDGVPYRLAGSQCTVFVPSDARAVTIPIRSVVADVELEVALTLNGTPANIVRVPPRGWYDVHLSLAHERHAPRFHRLELRIRNWTAVGHAGPTLMVGKAVPHP